MATCTQPPKQLVREYLEQRKSGSTPPPSPEEIRRQLGWGMLIPEFKLSNSRS